MKLLDIIFALNEDAESDINIKTNEGMDNAFFLSKDVNYAAEYPVPKSSTMYQNINNKKEEVARNAKKITKRKTSRKEREEKSK